MRNVWTIARREYSRFFSSPVAYVIAVVMLAVLGFMFWLTLLVYSQNSLGGAGAPDMSGITSTFTFILVLSVPALTMRLVADETRMGTMELLLTAPVRDWELIVGKWLGGFLYILTLIGVTINFVGLDPIKALFWTAVINGVIAVPLMIVMMIMTTQPKVMGQFTLPRTLRVVGWLATAVMAIAVITMFATW